MSWTISMALVILWLLGLVSGYAKGNFVHILLFIAIVVVLIRVIQGRGVKQLFYAVLYFLACLFDLLSGFLYLLIDFLAGIFDRALFRAAKWPNQDDRSSM